MKAAKAVIATSEADYHNIFPNYRYFWVPAAK